MSTFLMQAIAIRYCDQDKLAAELDKVLGDGNWEEISVLWDHYTLKVKRLLTEAEIKEISENSKVDYKCNSNR